MIGLTSEQQLLAKEVHDYACRFPVTEEGDAQLLEGSYDYMESFKQVLESLSKIQIDYICQQYPGFLRFATWMEFLAQGIAEGVIDV